MILDVNPNRMELLRLKKRLLLGRRGHKLLKDKQEELMRRFMELIEEVKALRREAERELKKAYLEYLSGRCLLSKDSIILALSYPKKTLRLSAKLVNVLNLKMPKLEMEAEPQPFTYGFRWTSGTLDLFLKRALKLLPKLIRLAEVESYVDMLAREIERTRRRVNALEYVLIPNLEETVGYIEMRLEEFERSNLTRLMRVKELLGKS